MWKVLIILGFVNLIFLVDVNIHVMMKKLKEMVQNCLKIRDCPLHYNSTIVMILKTCTTLFFLGLIMSPVIVGCIIMYQNSPSPIYLVFNSLKKDTIEVTEIKTRINQLPENMKEFQGKWTYVSETVNDENYEQLLNCGDYGPFNKNLIVDKTHCSTECFKMLQNLTVGELHCHKFQSIIIIEEEGVRNQLSRPQEALFQKGDGNVGKPDTRRSQIE